MRIQFDENLIELSVLEHAPKGQSNEGDVHITAQVLLGKFSAIHKSIWIEEPALNDFINKLSALESTRSGSATLESCSPEDFKLSIHSRDSLGHFVVEVSLCQYQYSGPKYWPIRLSGGFEIDPASIHSILSDFQVLHAGG